jgi:amino acid transporter
MFIPYLYLFLALIRLVRRPGVFAAGQVPGGVPVAIALASVGFISTAMTILLSAIPPPEEPNQALAIGKLLLSSAGVLLAGAAVFALGARRKRRLAESQTAV